MDEIIKGRERVTEAYKKCFEIHTQIKPLKLRPETQWNHSYYPILFENEEALIAAENELKANEILARRYFYPSLSELDYVNSGEVEIAKSTARRVLCLPVYYNLDNTEMEKIVNILNQPVC
jgi:dTDP-4-amino-4,6-dideoxygalactose transaminase